MSGDCPLFAIDRVNTHVPTGAWKDRQVLLSQRHQSTAKVRDIRSNLLVSTPDVGARCPGTRIPAAFTIEWLEDDD